MIKGKMLKNEKGWAAYPDIKDSAALVMMGTAVGNELQKPKEEIKFVEDAEDERKRQEEQAAAELAEQQ